MITEKNKKRAKLRDKKLSIYLTGRDLPVNILRLHYEYCGQNKIQR
jgi:hypothetical protein